MLNGMSSYICFSGTLLSFTSSSSQLTIQFYDRTSIINPCLESSVRFVEKLVGEVKQMHDDANVPLDSYHFGGDEAKNILLGAGYASYPEARRSETAAVFQVSSLLGHGPEGSLL